MTARLERYMNEYFVRMSFSLVTFWLLLKKFVRKIRVFNVDKIDTC
jgi:hypothetical protein